MSGSISILPSQQTNALGSFFVTSKGYVQGTMLDDPVARFAIAQGIVSPSATSPMWGGIGITDLTPNPGTEADAIGSVLTLATAVANLTGFTVFNQATAMIQSAQSQAPLAPAGGAINFFRFGSGARIAVACSSAVATTLENSASNTPVYWDYTNQVLLTSGTGVLPVKVLAVNAGNSRTVSYSSVTGFASWANNGSTVIIQL